MFKKHCCIAFWLLVALNGPAYAQALFGPKTDYAVGSNPSTVFAADLDGDGDNDLALANFNSSNTSVLLNNRDGTFATKVDYATGKHPHSVFIADLDGDGDNDLVVANNASKSVSVLLNNRDGTFAPKVDYSVGDVPLSAFIADLDGDGDNDMAVANNASKSVSVLLNNRDGTFAPKVDYSVGDVPLSAFIADLDGDGDNDLAVANSQSKSVSVLLNFSNVTPPFVVTSIDPTSGTELRGTPVVIKGSNFQSGATVTFGDSSATNIAVNLLGTITAKTSAHPAGTVDVIVTNPNGLADTLFNGFEFITIPPVIVGAGEEIAGPGGQALAPIIARGLDGKDVVSGEITLRSDPTLVQFIRAFPGPGHSFPSGFVFNSPEPGSVVIAFASIAQLFDTPEGILAFAVLQVSPGALLGSRIDIFVPENQSNVNEGLPPVTTFDGGITVELVGDISRNGQIKSFDATLALMHSVRFRDILVEFFGGNTDLFLAISDVTRNGEVTSMDGVRILQFVVGLIPGLPFLGPDGLAKVAEI